MTLTEKVKNQIRRWLLRLVFGKRRYDYLCSSLGQDRRLRNCHWANITIRKDSVEKSVEADWLKWLFRVCEPDLPPRVPQPEEPGFVEMFSYNKRT